MKSYIFAKKTTFALSYFSAFLVICMLAVYGIKSSYSSADTASDLPVRVMLNASVHDAPADSSTDIPINLSVDISFTPLVVDHVDLYATKPGYRLDLPYSDASKSTICSKVGSGELALIARSTPSNGNWSEAHWTSPNTPGIRQVFGVAYSTPATGCNTTAIQGWSIPDAASVVNIYRAQVSSGFIDVSTQTPVIKNQPLTVQASMPRPDGADHISILVLRKGSLEYDSVRPETLCSISGQIKATISCSASSCSGTKQISGLDQTGLHRVVAVAMRSSLSAPCDFNNIVGTLNKENIICVGDANDPNCDGAAGGDTDANPPSNDPAGNSSSNSSSTNSERAFSNPNLTNPTRIAGVGDILNKIEWFALTLIGVLAFLSVLYGGFAFMTAGGNEQQTKRAKNAIVFGIIGIVVVFLSWAIVSIAVDGINGIF